MRRGPHGYKKRQLHTKQAGSRIADAQRTRIHSRRKGGKTGVPRVTTARAIARGRSETGAVGVAARPWRLVYYAAAEAQKPLGERARERDRGEAR